ncbi:MAG: hypothetical protein EOO70_02945 [Myxococcaceae bacterium]|nr:MAG: hypothetical protein EOO70_02945 [Myxococcaceae bacterium]
MFPLRVRPATYPERFSGREPEALAERVKRAAEEQNRSVNEVRVTFQEMGAAAYEWMQEHSAALLPEGANQHADELLVTLLQEALVVREKKRR